jgi:hypothetical protein
MKSPLVQFFDKIRPLREDIGHDLHSFIITAATELSNEAYTQGFADAEHIYQHKPVTPDNSHPNDPQPHSMNIV